MTFEKFLRGLGLSSFTTGLVILLCVVGFVFLVLRKVNKDRVAKGKSSLFEKAKEAGEAVKGEAVHVGGMAKKMGASMKEDVLEGAEVVRKAVEDVKKGD